MSFQVFLPIDFLGNHIQPAESVRNYAVWFDDDFSLSKHMQNVCRGCFAQLRDFRRIRQYLTTDSSILVVNALISSRLAYCNSLFRSLSRFNLHKLYNVYRTVLPELPVASETSLYFQNSYPFL